MSRRIEDYAVIGNGETMALVGRNGSIDWLPVPRFDSAACFAALLGDSGNGRWLIAPKETGVTVERRYGGASLVLETTFRTTAGEVRVIDVMSRRAGVTDLCRIVEGVSGSVAMETELLVRFDYGSVVPWVMRRPDGMLQLTAGPDRLLLSTTAALRGEGMKTVGSFMVCEGERIAFHLSWSPSFDDPPEPVDALKVLEGERARWSQWTGQADLKGPHADRVLRSLVTLKGLAHHRTGGIVAAPTTSLPEWPGGPRNWDYRYCWLRDATFTLYALIGAGFLEEAKAWRRWLVRAAAGSPKDLQIMYGVAGERRLEEMKLPWLAGFEASTPVRVGNAASRQLQLDVFGEVLDTLYAARKAGLDAFEASWDLECALLQHLADIWEQPDSGIWEMRGPPRHFTHSKAMAWVAFDRGVRSCEEFGLDGPCDMWRAVRDRIHRRVCEEGFDRDQGSFVQYFGATTLDASLLLMPAVGFLPASDPRIQGTVRAIETRLLKDGLVMRYDTAGADDGLPPGEGMFLACSFWLADCYVLMGRYADAAALFERVAGLANDVGLLAEEYDPADKRMLGNFPQALSHLALINTARNLLGHGPAHERSSSPGVRAP